MSERLNRRERKAQTRDRLLDAAAEVFAQRGFEAASLDEVAAAAGFTKGAVYSNFESKTDLLIALLQRRIEDQSAQLARRFAGRDPDAVVRGLLEPVVRLPESEKQFVMLAMEFWLHAMRDDRARALVAEQYERARTLMSAFLVEAGYEKIVPEPRLAPRDMAIVIEAVGTGLAMQAALDPEHVDLGLEAAVIARLLRLAPAEAETAVGGDAPGPADSPEAEGASRSGATR